MPVDIGGEGAVIRSAHKLNKETGSIRIISSRKATKKEMDMYHKRQGE